MFAFSLFALAGLLPAFAAPAARNNYYSGGCDLSDFKFTPPAGYDFPTPQGVPKFVTVGGGTQNYTCGAEGKYTPAGAIATLVDTSCIIFLDEFVTIQDDIITALNDAYGLNGRTYDESSFEFDILADHYFVVNPVTGQGISPKFDFSPSVGDFVVGTGSVSNPAPTGSQDINWLRLTNIEGSLSHEVYRVDTRGGQPPSSCDPYVDGELLVIYAAKYLFF